MVSFIKNKGTGLKLITRDTDYAVRAVCHIAKFQDRPVSVDELVESLKIPRAFLRKILQVLSKNKILKSFRGKTGGFSLNMPEDEIYLTNIMKIFQKQAKLNICVFKKRICPNIKKCILRKKLTKIEKYIFSEISQISMHSLIDKQKDR
jgi:Rrf2 family protein